MTNAAQPATRLATTRAPKQTLNPYADADSFATAQRIAQSLAASTMVPEHYRGEQGMANCLLALELAHRMGASPWAVMQNCDIIAGRPSWRATFVIASIATCGRFEPLRFAMAGEGMDRRCMAWTNSLKGERLEGPTVSMGMAKAEGWIDRKGSKWKTMPEIMLRYRAASFFGRLYAPDVLAGMHTVEEAEEMPPIDLVATADGVYVPRTEVDMDDPAGNLMRGVKGEAAPQEAQAAPAPTEGEEPAPEAAPGAPESAPEPRPDPAPQDPAPTPAPSEPPPGSATEGKTGQSRRKPQFTPNELAAAISRAATQEELDRVYEAVAKVRAKATRERLTEQMEERRKELGVSEPQ